MARRPSSEPITVRTAKVAEIDRLAAAMDRSRNYVVNEAIEQYLAANSWQIDRISEGMADARAGRTVPAAELFASIADEHGWPR